MNPIPERLAKIRVIPVVVIDDEAGFEYLNFSQVMACGGSWMLKSDLVIGKMFDEISRLAARAVGIARDIGATV